MFRPAMVPPYVNGKPVGNYVEWHPGVVLTPSLAGYNNRKWTGLTYTATINYAVPFVKGLNAKASYNKYSRDISTRQFNLPYNMTLFEGKGTNGHIVGDKEVGLRPRATQEFLLARNDKINRYQLNLQLNYKKSWGLHNLDALAVYEQAEEEYEGFFGRRDDFLSNEIDQFPAGSSVGNTAGGGTTEFGRLAYVGILSYNYDQKYLLEASFRYDGSVIFAPGKRWGFFPSVSAGWRVSDENFFKNVKFVDDLKIRASVGLLGNDSVGTYQYIRANQIAAGAIFDKETIGLEPGRPANPDITWEKSLNYNVGIDARFWGSRMGLKLDLFFRHTYDLLMPRDLAVPTTIGTSLPDENYGEFDSKGFDIELDYTSPSSGNKNKFNWYVRGNFGLATNKALVWNEAASLRPYLKQTGHNLGRIYGLQATGILRTQKDIDALPAGYTIMGVAPALGMLNYRDIRGVNSDEPDGKITADDRDVIADYSIGGNSTHPINFGLSLGGAWKNFSFDILFQGMSGAKAMLPTAGRDIQGRAEESSFQYWADSWSPENPNGKYPGWRVANNYRTRFDESDFFLVDNSFIRLKNVTVGYTLPQSIISKAGVKNCRVYFTGTNMLMIYTGNKIYDPEMNNILSYPMMASYTFGLNLGL